jgi:hypothetical protein
MLAPLLLGQPCRIGREVVSNLELNGGSSSPAQTLIHEMAHVIGIDSECEATKIEYSITGDSGEEIARSAYHDRCRLSFETRIVTGKLKDGAQ